MSGVGSSITSDACETSQSLLAGVSDVFLGIILFFFCFFFFFFFVCFFLRTGNKTKTDSLYPLQAMIYTKRQTLHRMHCAFDEMIVLLNNNCDKFN